MARTRASAEKEHEFPVEALVSDGRPITKDWASRRIQHLDTLSGNTQIFSIPLVITGLALLINEFVHADILIRTTTQTDFERSFATIAALALISFGVLTLNAGARMSNEIDQLRTFLLNQNEKTN